MTIAVEPGIAYPDSDGQPMADNTEQFQWIVLLKENLECLFAECSDVFVAGDLLWYPVQGRPDLRVAPDVMVALGRPKGKRGSYKQWEEGNQPPQVVFEILSPGNTLREMAKKQQFYNHYGVEEYYVYNPDRNDLMGFERRDGELMVIEEMADWSSPRLGIRFALSPTELKIYYPDGEPFLSTVELAAKAQQQQQRAEQAEAENLRLRALLAAAGLES